jgi:YD repeat-containing protein
VKRLYETETPPERSCLETIQFVHHMLIPPGGRHVAELHIHPDAEELLVITRRHGTAIFDGKANEVQAEDVIHVPTGAEHELRDTTDEMLGVLLINVPTGNGLALVDQNGNRISFTYNANGNEVEQIDPLGRRTTIAYDAADRQDLRIDARGNRTTYTHNANDQPTGRSYPNGTRATFVYDSVGNRITMQDTTGAYTTTFDALDRKQTVTNPADKTITYAYDEIGLRAQVTISDAGVTTYSYSANGQVDHLVNPESKRTSYSYDAAGRRLLKKLANGSRASFTSTSFGLHGFGGSWPLRRYWLSLATSWCRRRQSDQFSERVVLR